jgi:hypothetical protein
VGVIVIVTLGARIGALVAARADREDRLAEAAPAS